MHHNSDWRRSAGEPLSQWKGFQKVSLDAAEGKTIRIGIPVDSFAIWDEDIRSWMVWDGAYTFRVEESSREFVPQSSMKLSASPRFRIGAAHLFEFADPAPKWVEEQK